jgi:ectoine hydroxylase-related dioxygenase (phytanoyl-CoA dioxygenase family)
MMEFDLATAGVPPVGPDPRSPIYGARAYVETLAGLDYDSTRQTIETVHSAGYAVIPDLLTADETAYAREVMDPFFTTCGRMFGSDAPMQAQQTFHIHNLLGKTADLDSIAVNQRLRATVAGVLGFDFLLNTGAIAMSPDPGCAPQGLHRDDGYFALLPRPHMPLVLTVAIALDDFTKDNGATHLIQGSHMWPEERLPEPGEEIQIEMPAGSALIWDGALLHGGGGNRTADESRRTLTFNYTRGWLRTQFNQYLSVPRERILNMPVELAYDLGYGRSALGLGGCDREDPLAYLAALSEAGGDGAQSELGQECADPKPAS